MSTPERYLGLMSGTSMDGVDAVLCDFTAEGHWQGVADHAWQPFDPATRALLSSLLTSGPDELHRAALAANAVARAYAGLTQSLLARQSASSPRVRAIGAHGQTVRHQPGLHDGTGYTLQLLQPALLAHLTGIDVVADLRSADVAAGGQGAPLVPPFHAAVFAAGHGRVVVNIGGISNLTILMPGQRPRGFDCGPGNGLMDEWIATHLGMAFDRDGAWAAQGQVQHSLLARWLSEPYFSAPPPKSTGRDLFNPAWLRNSLHLAEGISAIDIQATLCELTAQSIAQDVVRWAPAARDVLVCGGGALNGHLMNRLTAHLPGRTVKPSDAFGLPAMQVEGAAFAWLARMHVHRKAANEIAVTGAQRAKILGALYPA